MENKEQVIADVRKKIGDAEIEPALTQLLVFLEKSPSYLDLHSDALQALSQYRKARREEAQGIITYDQAKLSYNQVVNQVLNILETLQREEKLGRPPRRRSLVIGTVVFFLLLTGAGAAWFANRQRGVAAAYPCPEFMPEDAFNVMLLPYRQLGGEKPVDEDTPVTLRQAFEAFGRTNNIPLSIRIPALRRRLLNSNLFPPSFELAGNLVEQCRARLIIWGTSERGPGGSQVFTTNYRFHGFDLQKLTMPASTVIETAEFTSKFGTEGEAVEQIETIIALLLGVIAHENDQPELAIRQLSRIESNDPQVGLVRDMMLADSYLLTDQRDSATETYTRVLEQHPEYWLGWYNRGVLNLEQGRYEEAAYDLSNRLALDSSDLEARWARSEAYLKMGKLTQAEKDLEFIREADPEKMPVKKDRLDRRTENVREAVEQQREIQSSADRQLQANPRNLPALREKTRADLQLGDTRDAIATARQWLEQAPDRREARQALQALVRAYQEAGQNGAAQAALDQAAQKGIITTQEADTFKSRLLEKRLPGMDAPVVRQKNR